VPLPPQVSVTGYAVYRFPRAQGDDRCGFADAAHLVASIRGSKGSRSETWSDSSARAGHRYAYYVTALDRAYRESRPGEPAIVR